MNNTLVCFPLLCIFDFSLSSVSVPFALCVTCSFSGPDTRIALSETTTSLVQTLTLTTASLLFLQNRTVDVRAPLESKSDGNSEPV